MSKTLAQAVSAEDILQQTYVQAFRDIRRFEPQTGVSFSRWLTAIAEHRLLDAVKAQNRKKRGGGLKRLRATAHTPSGSSLDLLAKLSDGGRTPSSLVAGHEARSAFYVAFASLPAEYREVLRLRRLEEKSLAEVASAMNRSEDAVRSLLYRAEKKLREAMGESSQWFDKK